MPQAYLTRATQFYASHRYYRPDWSEEENRRRFGAVTDVHEHAYRCEVTVRGRVHPQTGMVMDLAELDAILAEEVVSRLNGQHINSAMDEFKPGGAIPTTENLAAYILKKVSMRLPADVELHRVRVREEHDLWSDVYGSDVTQ